MPERDFELLDLVAAIGRAAARMDHVGADGAAQRALIAREDVRDAALGDWALALVVHPDGGRIGNKLLLRPCRCDHAVVFRLQEQLDKQAQTLPTHAGLVVLLRQLHRRSAYTFWPAAAAQVGNREQHPPIIAQTIIEPFGHLDIGAAQSLRVVESNPCELLPQGEKLLIVRVAELLDSLA